MNFKKINDELYEWASYRNRSLEEWPLWKSNGGVYDDCKNHSFMCEYDAKYSGDCSHCPMTYNSKNDMCLHQYFNSVVGEDKILTAILIKKHTKKFDI